MKTSSSFMLRHSFVLVLSAFVIAGFGWWLASPEKRSEMPRATSKINPPTTTVTDPALVFQKAFWKRPSAEDRILHADRREWADKEGVSKWQWFISVQPSSAMVDHLITDNAFMLSKTVKPLPAELPGWFPRSAEGFESYSNSTSTFLILWDKEKNLLHATDRGGGFNPGAPERTLPIAAAQPEGRLSTTPPPKP